MLESSEESFDFAVSKQIFVVYSVDRGRAETMYLLMNFGFIYVCHVCYAMYDTADVVFSISYFIMKNRIVK